MAIKKNVIGIDEMFNGMFGISSSMEITEVPIRDLVSYKRHKFKPSSKAKREATKESIAEFGVLEPIIIREKEDIPYEIKGRYEILAGHQRTDLCKELGKETIPAIIKKELNEDEAYQIHAETNWNRWEEMAHSERAEMLAAHYEALKNNKIRKEVLEEINTYLESASKLDNIRAEEGLSPMATGGIREVANECDLSKDTIARYLKINTLIQDIKLMIDDRKIAIRAAVELSYITKENQELFVSLIKKYECKCDIKKAQLIREYEDKGKLNIATMTEILIGNKKKKKPGRPAPFKVRRDIIEKYFEDEEPQKEIEDVIEKALDLYFKAQNNS